MFLPTIGSQFAGSAPTLGLGSLSAASAPGLWGSLAGGLGSAGAGVSSFFAPALAALGPAVLPLAVAGLAVGGIKSLFGRGEDEKKKKIEQIKTMYSPWTGMPGGQYTSGQNTMGNILQGGAAGLQQAQQIDDYAQRKQMLDAWKQQLSQDRR